jgi:formylglycine-generating enzyme required for sulfatase activity
MDARKYAECVAVLQTIKGSLRTPELHALQQEAAAKLSRLEKLQQIIDQAVQNNQLNGLLPEVEELLLLKSEVTEKDEQLRTRLVAQEQKQTSQIKSLLQKAQQLRKEAQFDKAVELLVRVPPDFCTDTLSASSQELINFSEQRSAVLRLLRLAREAEEIRMELFRAEQYRKLLASADITDVEFESALQGCRARLEELQRAAKLATQNRQWMIMIGSGAAILLLIVVAERVIQRHQRTVASAETQLRGNEALQASTNFAPPAMPTAETPAAEPIAIAQSPSPMLSLRVDLKNSIGMSFNLIPAGEFMMGSPASELGREGREEDETQHKVTLTKPFFLGICEVTQSEYEKVVGINPSKFKGAKNPVEQVSWSQAVEFCKLLSALPAEQAAGRVYRLPTEAEWEYACRAGSKTAYSFGESASVLGDYAWCGDNSNDQTHPVGEKKPNAWGLYDMHGNVAEWCSYCGDYPTVAVTDPVGQEGVGFTAQRGGGWGFLTDYRSADRSLSFSSYRSSLTGFRLAMSASKTPISPVR